MGYTITVYYFPYNLQCNNYNNGISYEAVHYNDINKKKSPQQVVNLSRSCLFHNSYLFYSKKELASKELCNCI